MKTTIDKTIKELQAKLERTKKAAEAYDKIQTIVKQAGFSGVAELEAFLASSGADTSVSAAKAPKLRVVAAPKAPATKKAPVKAKAEKVAGEKQTRTRLTAEQKDTIFTLTAQGKNPTEIAEITKIPYPTVYQTIRRQKQAQAA